MSFREVKFSVSVYAAWAPGIEVHTAWEEWARQEEIAIVPKEGNPSVESMPPMLRRRAGATAKMALEVAYECLGSSIDVPVVLCARHGEVARSLELLNDLVRDQPLSPTSFSMSVHNAAGGLFSIARADRANQIAVSTSDGGVEPAVLEACSLLADGATEVMLVAYDRPLPQKYSPYRDCLEQAFGWAWLLKQAGKEHISLSWQASDVDNASFNNMSLALAAQRFLLRGDKEWLRRTQKGCWHWKRHG